MKAIVCEAYGAIDDLKYQEVADLKPGKGQVKVKVKAVGVNFPDGLLVQGLYQAKPEVPFTPGSEYCGEVIEAGKGADRFKPGQRLMCMSPNFGGFAEEAIIHQNMTIPVPDFMSDNDAASLLCAYGTAHHALKQRANLQEGETLVVLGAAGGTGLAAVQIGKQMGARVIAVCSNEQKLAVAKESGADEFINYTTENLKQRIKELTDGKGADVVYDAVGGDAFMASAGAMARNGRLLVIGFASGTIPKLPVNLTLVKEFSVVGVFWGAFVQHEAKVFAQNMAELFAWHQQGKVHINVDEVFDLSDTAKALDKVMSRKVAGKVIVSVQ